MFLILFFSTSISSSLHVTISRILMPQRTQTNKQTQFKCGPCYGYSMIFVVVFIAINSDRLSTISTDHHLSISNTQQTLILRFSMFFLFFILRFFALALHCPHTQHTTRSTHHTHILFFFLLIHLCCAFCVCVFFLPYIFFTACLFIEIMNLLALADHHSHVHTLIHVYQWFCDILALLFDA